MSSLRPISSRNSIACCLLAISAVLLLSSCGGSGNDSGEAPSNTVDPSKPSFTASPALIPAFRTAQTDYAVRCADKPVTVSLHLPEGWRGRVAGSPFQASGNRVVKVSMEANQARVVKLANASSHEVNSYHVRCLPKDFTPFTVEGKGGPRLTLTELTNGYAAAFDSGGAPVWWYKAKGFAEDAKFLPDDTVAYAPVNGIIGRKYEVRTLDGRYIRTVVPANGLKMDLHDLQLLPNGNYMFGAHRDVDGVDTKPYGGPAKAPIDTAQIQELRPDGSLVWKWNAYPRIGLAETGRWWKQLLTFGKPYDVNHWNSVDRRGNRVLLSFRHLDAVYLIDYRTGKILWKLGGTKTPQSLRVIGDPRGDYPFGGQHDARFEPGGSITVFDNDTDLANPDSPTMPRGVRYRINDRKKTATLINEIKDPDAPTSIGFGSNRSYGKGRYLIDWGARSRTGLIGGYRADGKRIFSIVSPGAVSYRANEVNRPTPTIERLRRAMDIMFLRGK